MRTFVKLRRLSFIMEKVCIIGGQDKRSRYRSVIVNRCSSWILCKGEGLWGLMFWNYSVFMCFHLSRIKVLKLFETIFWNCNENNSFCFDMSRLNISKIIKNVARCILTLFGTILELQRNFEKRGR